MADHATNVWTDPASPVARYELRCWGQFALFDRIDRQERSPRSRKGRAIIAHLWSLGGAPINRERLAGLLWSERADEQARGSLRQSLFELKGLASGKRKLLIVERDQIRINPDMLASDAARMELLARFGNLKELTRALSEKGDRLFEGLDGLDPAFDDWLSLERSKQFDRVIECSVEAANRGLARGATDEVRKLVSCLQHLDEANETIACVGMRADHAAGETGAANLRFRKLKGVLDRELHVEPSCETHSLLQALVSSSPTEPPAIEAGRGVPGRGARPMPRRRAPVSRRVRWAWLLFAALIAAIGAALFWERESRAPAIEPVSIAVMPFQDMSAGRESYLAEGFSDEILERLARNPDFAVLGRSSAAMYGNGDLDPRSIGRKLNVDYLLEGSVRATNRQVRVLVSLLRTKDGVLLWSERYDRPLNDILAVQGEIGSAVAQRLNKGPTGQRAAEARARTTRGDVYSLYLTARSLIHAREAAKTSAAADLLARAVNLDPRFAPAWAALSLATMMRSWDENDPARARKSASDARRFADKALALAPGLSDAHVAAAAALDLRGPRARAHLDHAVRLNPHDAEAWFWLGSEAEYSADYPAALDAYRRAAAIEPLWSYSVGFSTRVAWSMGHHGEARRYVRKMEAAGNNRFDIHMMREVLAAAQRDFSTSVKEGRAALATSDLGPRAAAEWHISRSLGALGQIEEVRRLLQPDGVTWSLMQGKPPTIDALIAEHPRPSDVWNGDITSYLFPRLALNAGRPSDVVRLFDRAFESPSMMASSYPGGTERFLADAPSVIVALRAVGRGREASQLLALAEAEARRILRRGDTPYYFPEICAQLRALGGNRTAALDALERSLASGWYWYSDITTPLGDISNEPAFRDLRDEPRFLKLRARLRAFIERERRELGPAPIAAARGAIPPVQLRPEQENMRVQA